MSIQKLKDLGDDTFSNLFKLEIDLSGTLLPTATKDFFTENIARITKFAIAETSVPTSDISCQGVKLSILMGKEEIVQEATFEIRLDKNYETYRHMLVWKNSISNASGSASKHGDGFLANSGSPNLLGAIAYVTALARDNVSQVFSWSLKGVYVKKIPQIDYDYSSNEPIILAVTFGFFTSETINSN